MNNIELKNKLVDLVNNHATVYAYGCWGNKLTESLINSKAKQYSWWYTSSKKAQLIKMTKLGYTVWGFDCVNMIKGILWGWKADTSKNNGGAVYASNGVPDTNADGMIKLCKNVSTDFSNIEIGEAVWLKGHIGIYIGNGEVIECTPAWKNKVQVTKLSQRNWLKHGKLPYITYQTTTSEVKGTITVNAGTWNVRKGAGTSYAVVKVVQGGIKLDHYGTVNGWYKIKDGYISSKAAKQNATQTTNSYKVTTGNVNFRSSAKYGNNVICVIKKGTKVTYIGGTGWAKIKYNGKTGFVGDRYLK